MSKLRIAKVPAFVATTSTSMNSRRIALTVSFILFSSIITPSASVAAGRNYWYDCGSSAPITLTVDPGDNLAFNAQCWPSAMSVGSYNSSILENASGNSITKFFRVKSSATPGTYVNAIDLYDTTHTLYTIIVRGTVSVPSAPTLTSTAVGINEITLNFSAGANGGATITDYKYSINGGGYISAGVTSSPISITGLSSNTTYSVRILARNSQGDGAASNSLTATTSLSAADIEAAAAAEAEAKAAAAKAAAAAAAAKREAEKRDARAELVLKAINKQALNVDLFNKADISGVSASNIAAVQADIFALTDFERSNIEQIVKVARKFEVVALIGSDRVRTLSPTPFVEIGLIPQASKIKTSLVVAVRALPESNRKSYAEINAAINAKAAELESRKDRIASIITRIKSR